MKSSREQPKPKKCNALVIFRLDFETDARAFVEQQLQYQGLFDNVYMLRVGGGDAVPSLETLLDSAKTVAGESLRNLEMDACFLIMPRRGARTIVFDSDGVYHAPAIVNMVTRYDKRFLVLTVFEPSDAFRGDDLTRFCERAGARCDAFSRDDIAQVALTSPPLFGHPVPPYQFLSYPRMPDSSHPAPSVKTEEEKTQYQKLMRQVLKSRQQKVEAVLDDAEHNYPDPETIAEKIADIFDAYVSHGVFPSHKAFARELASNLRDAQKVKSYIKAITDPRSIKFAKVPSTEGETLSVEECAFYLTDRIFGYGGATPLNPQDAFMGVAGAVFSALDAKIAAFQLVVGLKVKAMLEDRGQFDRFFAEKKYPQFLASLNAQEQQAVQALQALLDATSSEQNPLSIESHKATHALAVRVIATKLRNEELAGYGRTSVAFSQMSRLATSVVQPEKIRVAADKMLDGLWLLQTKAELMDIFARECGLLNSNIRLEVPAKYSHLPKVLPLFQAIEKELKNLAALPGKPHAVLLRAVGAANVFFKNPTDVTRDRLKKAAVQVGRIPGGEKLKGLLLILAGLALGAALGAGLYFSGGSAMLFAAPVVIQGVTLSTTLLSAGVAALAGATLATPFAIAGATFFAKPSLQKNMEALADVIPNRPIPVA